MFETPSIHGWRFLFALNKKIYLAEIKRNIYICIYQTDKIVEIMKISTLISNKQNQFTSITITEQPNGEFTGKAFLRNERNRDGSMKTKSLKWKNLVVDVDSPVKSFDTELDVQYFNFEKDGRVHFYVNLYTLKK